MSPEQARSELVDALRQMVTGSEQEAAQAQERAATIIAQQAGISPEQANQRLDQLQAEIQQRTDQAAAQATEAADTAASAASSASIWAFVALVLGACAAAAGGAMGTRNRFEHAYEAASGRARSESLARLAWPLTRDRSAPAGDDPRYLAPDTRLTASAPATMCLAGGAWRFQPKLWLATMLRGNPGMTILLRRCRQRCPDVDGNRDR